MSVSEEESWKVGGLARTFGRRFDLDDLLVVGIALTLALTGISSLLTPLGNIAVAAVVVFVWLARGITPSAQGKETV